MRSRITVTSLRGSCLRLDNFRMRIRGSNADNLTETLTRSFSLFVLSLVLPNVSNFRVYGEVHRGGGAPVLVISTGGSSVSGVEKLKLNTSSCIAGPFSPSRLITEMGTRLTECRHLVKDTAPRGSVIRVHNVGVSGATHHI